MCIRCEEQASLVILADIVSYHAVQHLGLADQDKSALIVMAVVVLIDRSAAPVTVISLSVAVEDRSVALVVLEYSILTAPRPDSCIVHGSMLRVLARSVADIVFDQRFDREHRDDCIAAGLFHIVISDQYIRVSVSIQDFLRDISAVSVPEIRG